jgi:hypothetical protein
MAKGYILELSLVLYFVINIYLYQNNMSWKEYLAIKKYHGQSSLSHTDSSND